MIKKINYIKIIDFYRAISVLLVFLYHLKIIESGFLGVDFFFIISGFIITKVLTDQFNNKNYSITAFLARRARRLLPLFFFTTLITLVIFNFFLLPEYETRLIETSISNLFFVSNFYFWLNNISYFSENIYNNPLFHMWSLSIEIQYYIVFSIVYLFIFNYSKEKNFYNLKKILIIYLFIYFVFFLLGKDNYFLKNYFFDFYSSFFRTSLFLFGSIIFIYKYENKKIIYSQKLSSILVALGLGLILFYIKSKYYLIHPNIYSFIPIFGFLLIFIFLENIFILNKIFSKIYFTYLGKISYSIYCVHIPIIVFFYTNGYSIDEHIALITFLTLTISLLTYHFIENKFRSASISNYNFLKSLVFVFLSVLFFSLFITKHNNEFTKQNTDKLFVSNEQHQRYVVKNYNIYKNIKSNNVLIIGDSYSQDFLNIVIHEKPKLDVEIMYLSVRCNPFDSNIKLKSGCFNLHSKIDKIKNSKLTVFAFNWSLDKAHDMKKYLDEYPDIKSKSIVVGKKYFGKFSKNKFQRTSQLERSRETNIVPIEFDNINVYMKQNFSNYIDLKKLTCPKKLKCRLFTDNGDLITFDGGHLTAEGVQHFSDKLQDNIWIKKILN